MLKRIMLLFFPVLLLVCFYQLQPNKATTYQLGAFNLPAIITGSSFTQDTTHLPHVKLIQAEPSVSPDTEAYLLKGIVHMYKFYITKFDYAFPKDLTIRIRVFSDIDDYKTYTSRIASISNTSHIGLFVHATQEIVVWQGPDPEVFKKTVFHETSHLLLRSQSRFCPRWLNEGLSEYFEQIDFTRPLPVVYANMAKDEWMKTNLLKGKALALKDYFTLTNNQWELLDIKSNNNRTIGWSLVYYLMGSENGQQMIKDLLSFYNKHPMDQSESLHLINTLAVLDSLAGIHPEKPVVFEKSWRKWVKQERVEQQVILEPLEQNYLTDARKWVAIQWRL